jgi:hypothetical protein
MHTTTNNSTDQQVARTQPTLFSTPTNFTAWPSIDGGQQRTRGLALYWLAGWPAQRHASDNTQRYGCMHHCRHKFHMHAWRCAPTCRREDVAARSHACQQLTYVHAMAKTRASLPSHARDDDSVATLDNQAPKERQRDSSIEQTSKHGRSKISSHPSTLN